jgi:hypothetical protein
MGIKNIFLFSICLCIGGFLFSCKKETSSCPNLGIEYNNNSSKVSFYPDDDSIPLGNSIIIEAYAPRHFYDSIRKKNVFLNETNISGSIAVFRVTNNPTIPLVPGMEYVSFIPVNGNIKKDTTQFSVGQLAIIRTSVFEILQPDSFYFKCSMLPNERGTYIINFSRHHYRQADCSIFRYNFKAVNPQRHFYLCNHVFDANAYEQENLSSYCFKVY